MVKHIEPLITPDPKNEDNVEEIALHDTADYIKNIGPEDADTDVIQEGLENYGFDQLDESHFESEVTAASDQPDWMNEEAKKRANADYPHTDNPDGMYKNDV